MIFWRQPLTSCCRRLKIEAKGTVSQTQRATSTQMSSPRPPDLGKNKMRIYFSAAGQSFGHAATNWHSKSYYRHVQVTICSWCLLSFESQFLWNFIVIGDVYELRLRMRQGAGQALAIHSGPFLPSLSLDVTLHEVMLRDQAPWQSSLLVFCMRSYVSKIWPAVSAKSSEVPLRRSPGRARA